MAAGDLTWGSITICDDSNGDKHQLIGVQGGSLKTADIAFGNTAGMELREIGNQVDNASALSLVYGNSNLGSTFAINTSESALWALVGPDGTIEDAMRSTTTAIATLVDKSNTYTGMRLVKFTATPPKIFRTSLGGSVDADKYISYLEMVFTRYTVPSS